MEARKHVRLRTIIAVHHENKYVYRLLTYTDVHMHSHVFCYFGHFGMGCTVWSAVVMEMRSACQLKSTKHLFVLSPASYCAPRLNRQRKLRTSGYSVIQNKPAALAGFTSSLKFPVSFLRVPV